MIPSENSKAELLAAQLGWNVRPVGDGSNLAVETCPIGQHQNFKFFIGVGPENDGLWDCKVCGRSGNFTTLQQELGVTLPNATSVRDIAAARTAPQALLDHAGAHWRLLNDVAMQPVLDYLIGTRGFSTAIIERLKLGAVERDGVKSYLIPYFDAAGNYVYYKTRSIPPAKKQFDAPAGRVAPLYNQQALKPNLEEIVLVEGEADCIALLDKGFENVVGVPGAANKKAEWIALLDRLAPKQIYLLYDKDKPGQENARDMAVRIGIEKVKNILLPDFTISDEFGEEHPGKDINEFFANGHTLDEFLESKTEAKLFDVHGVQNLADVLAELREDLTKHGSAPTYATPWAPLTKRLGGVERGDVIGLLAEAKVGKTTFGLDWAEWHTRTYDEPGMIFCLEMPAKRVVRKWVSHVTQTDDTPGASYLTADTVDAAITLAGERQGDLVFGYTRVNRAQEVFDTIRQAVRRYGIKFLVFDNLQLLVRSIEHQAQETAKYAKMFKELAMELGIIILLIIQPHRVPEGQIVSARNALGSSEIEKAVDAMVCLHRNRQSKLRADDFRGQIETDDNFDPFLLVRVDLARYAPGGLCTLFFNGATSTVRELGDVETALYLQQSAQPSGAIPSETQEV